MYSISSYFLLIATMSRSALWRQEGAKKMREKEAEDLFSMAVEEGRVSEKISSSRSIYEVPYVHGEFKFLYYHFL